MRFHIDHGADGDGPRVGYLEIQSVQVLERLKHCALVPCLIKPPGSDDFRVDHFDLIPRTSVETRPLEEIHGRL